MAQAAGPKHPHTTSRSRRYDPSLHTGTHQTQTQPQGQQNDRLSSVDHHHPTNHPERPHPTPRQHQAGTSSGTHQLPRRPATRQGGSEPRPPPHKAITPEGTHNTTQNRTPERNPKKTQEPRATDVHDCERSLNTSGKCNGAMNGDPRWWPRGASCQGALYRAMP